MGLPPRLRLLRRCGAAAALALLACASVRAAPLPPVLDAVPTAQSAAALVFLGGNGGSAALVQNNPYIGTQGWASVARSDLFTVSPSAGAALPLVPVLQGDGLSAIDIGPTSCWNASHCMAAGGGSYTPVSRGIVLLSTTGGASWTPVYTCVSGNTDSAMMRGAAWHSASVLSAWGRNVICFSRDGGATWSTTAVYRPGSGNSYASDSGDAGNMHLMRNLTGGGTTIALVCTPSKLSAGNYDGVYVGTLTVATGAVSLTTLVTVANAFSYSQYLHFPPTQSAQASLGFLLTSYNLWSTTNGGASWSDASTGLDTPSTPSARQPACPRGASGYCYTTDNAGFHRAVSPFTSWSSMSVTLPATPTGRPAWVLGVGFRGMECAYIGGADFCAVALTSTGTEGVADARLLITRDGWATTQTLATAATLSSLRASATFPSLRDTGPGTAPSAMLWGGGRGTLLSLALDSSLAMTRLAPPAPRTGGLALAFFGEGSCTLVGTDISTACSPGTLSLTAASTRWTLGAAAINATYTAPGNTAASAAALFSPTAWLLALSEIDAASSTFARVHTAWLTTSAGATYASVCTVYTPAGNAVGLPTPPTRQIKLAYARASNSAAATEAVYIVHPFVVHLWDGTATGSSCGTTVVTLPPPSIATASSTSVNVPMAVAMGCSPDPARGCFLLKASMTHVDASGYYFRDWDAVASVAIYGDCGVQGAFSGAALASADLSTATTNYANMLWSSTADVLFGSASAGLAYLATPGALFLTANGATWTACSLIAVGCLPSIVDTPGYTRYVSAAAFSNASVAFAFVADNGYAGPSIGAPVLLRFTYTYSAAGVGSVTGTVLDLTSAAGGSSNALLLPDNALVVAAVQMATQPRYWPVVDNTGATGCTALPNSYTPPAPAAESSTVSPSPSPSGLPTPSGSASTTQSASASHAASTSAIGTTSPSPASSPSVSPSASAAATPSGSQAAQTPSETPSGTLSASQTPSVTASPSEEASITATPSQAASESVTSSQAASESVSPSQAASESVSPSQAASESVSPLQTASESASPSQTASPTASTAQTASPTASTAQTASLTASTAQTVSESVSPSQTASESVSPSQTAAETVSPSQEASPTASPSLEASVTVSPTSSESTSPTDSPSATRSASASTEASPSASPSESAAATLTTTPSVAGSPSASQTESLTATPSNSVVPTLTTSPTATSSASPSQAASPTVSPSFSTDATPTVSLTATSTVSPSEAASQTASPSESALSTSPSATSSASTSLSATSSVLGSGTPSPSTAATYSASQSESATTSASVSASPSATATTSASVSASPSASATTSASVSASPVGSPTASASPLPAIVAFSVALVYPLTGDARAPTADNATATLLGLRCDYASIVGAPLDSVRIIAAAGVAINVSAYALHAALAAAAAATSCPTLQVAAPAAARRALQAAPAGTQPWASLTVQVASEGSAAALASIIAAVTSATAGAFPLATAAWAPVWALAPDAWVSAYGTPFYIAAPPVGSNVFSFSSTPLAIAPATGGGGGLTQQQQLGLGLGIGLSLALILAIILAYVCCCTRAAAACGRRRNAEHKPDPLDVEARGAGSIEHAAAATSSN